MNAYTSDPAWGWLIFDFSTTFELWIPFVLITSCYVILINVKKGHSISFVFWSKTICFCFIDSVCERPLIHEEILLAYHGRTS